VLFVDANLTFVKITTAADEEEEEEEEEEASSSSFHSTNGSFSLLKYPNKQIRRTRTRTSFSARL
jgi:hypothetical protein